VRAVVVFNVLVELFANGLVLRVHGVLDLPARTELLSRNIVGHIPNYLSAAEL
jgi:hypothetical protein